MLKIRLVYYTRGLTYVPIQDQLPYNKMLKHTDNQKKHGNAENKTAFYYHRLGLLVHALISLSGKEIMHLTKSVCL